MFILEDVKVNMQVNLNLLRDHALTWVRGSFPNGYVFAQDGVPSHTPKLTQQWCRSSFHGFWDKDRRLLPSSPDFNPWTSRSGSS